MNTYDQIPAVEVIQRAADKLPRPVYELPANHSLAAGVALIESMERLTEEAVEEKLSTIDAYADTLGELLDEV